MKKTIVRFITALSLFTVLSGSAQTVIPNCTYTPCQSFSNGDSKQIWNALANLYVLLSGGGGGTTTPNFKDNNSDTLNNRLNSIRYEILKGLFSNGGTSTPAYLTYTNKKLDSLITKVWGTQTVNVTNTVAVTGSVSVVNPIEYTLTVSSSTASGSGTITAGNKSIGITTSPTFSGTINGVSRSPNTFYSFGTQQSNAVLSTVTYSVSAGSITIDKIQ